MSPKRTKHKTAIISSSNPELSPVNSGTEPPETPAYIVDRVFRRGSISLLGGPTYAGKTTLLFQIIRDWMAGMPIFGQESYPAPCCYVTAVHSAGDAWDVMTRVGAEVKVLSTDSHSERSTFETVCMDALAAVPDVQVVFLDGIHPMCNGNSNDPGVVTTTLTGISKLLFKYNLTLVATGCFSKPKDHYSSGRDRFAGAYSWLQGSSSFVSIDFQTPHNPADPRRLVVVHSKSGLAIKLNYRFNDHGTLAPVLNGMPSRPEPRYDDFDDAILAHDPGTILARHEIVNIGESLNLSESSIKRHLIELQDAGHVTLSKWGHYQIGRKQ